MSSVFSINLRLPAKYLFLISVLALIYVYITNNMRKVRAGKSEALHCSRNLTRTVASGRKKGLPVNR